MEAFANLLFASIGTPCDETVRNSCLVLEQAAKRGLELLYRNDPGDEQVTKGGSDEL